MFDQRHFEMAQYTANNLGKQMCTSIHGSQTLCSKMHHKVLSPTNSPEMKNEMESVAKSENNRSSKTSTVFQSIE